MEERLALTSRAKSEAEYASLDAHWLETRVLTEAFPQGYLLLFIADIIIIID